MRHPTGECATCGEPIYQVEGGDWVSDRSYWCPAVRATTAHTPDPAPAQQE